MHPRDLPEHVQQQLQFSGMAGVGAILRSGFGAIVQSSTGAAHRIDDVRTAFAPPPDVQVPDIEVCVARSADQIERARDLVRKRYTRRGYRMVEDSGIPFPTPARASHFFPIVATAGGRLLGTVTLGADSPAGLMVDDAHRDTVNAIRGEGGFVCELVRLALDENVDTKMVLTVLFEYLHRMAVDRFRLTDLLIEVIPQHANYYCRLLGFERASAVRYCQRVGGVKSVLLRLRRADIEARLIRI